MDSRTAFLVLLLLALPVRAADTVPADKRMPVHVQRTIAAPADDPLEMPTDVAVDSNGRVFVADGVNHRIVRFNHNGEFEATIVGDYDGFLERPVGVTCDAENRLWVADTGNHRVIVFSPGGDVEEVFNLPAVDAEHQADPTDVFVTPDGSRTYVVDNDNHRLVVRDHASGIWSSLGKPGTALGQFQFPFMIAADSKGTLFVTDVIGARVQMIGPGDEWRGQLGRWGVELGRLYRPKGVAVDLADRVFVSDSSLGVVQAFDLRGRLAGVLTDPSGKPHAFLHPMGMCFDKNGLLYVVELRADCVTVLSFDAPEPVEPATDRLP